jgi:Icc protein
MRGVNTYDTFRAVITQAMNDRRSTDAVIATGDLVQDETRTGYERFRETLGNYNLPVYCIPGNHDSPTIMTDVLDKPPFQVCGRVQMGNWSVILLNSFSSGDDGGRLSDPELLRLRETLSATSSSHTLICIHHHPVPMGSRWLDGVALRNSDEFFDIVEQYSHVRGILWGHVHQASDRQRNGVRLMSTPSTCSQFLPNSDGFALDEHQPGYRWLEICSDGTIDTEIVWLEKI